MKKPRISDRINEPPEAQSVREAAGFYIEHDERMLDAWLWLYKYAMSTDVFTIRGSRGTGKGILAHAAHILRVESQGRANRKRGKKIQFRSPVVLNITMLSENLIESELFGHRKGSFTDAHDDRQGKLKEAEEVGTLFLDEIGNIGTGVQSKLLGVLEHGTYSPVGSNESFSTEGVKIILATNKSLEFMVRQNEELGVGYGMMPDFYDRIKNFVWIPNLDERTEQHKRGLFQDILLRNNFGIGRCKVTLQENSIRYLLAQTLPGNVREVKNAIRGAAQTAKIRAEQAKTTVEEIVIEPDDLELEITNWSNPAAVNKESSNGLTAKRQGSNIIIQGQIPAGTSLKNIKRMAARAVVDESIKRTNSVHEAARELDVSRFTIDEHKTKNKA